MIQELDLVVLGLCSHSNQQIEGLSEFKGLPEHYQTDGSRCPHSGYSPSVISYRIDTPEQATALAKVVFEDTTKCLSGNSHHTLACGDGERCRQERSRRSKALAAHILQLQTA